MQKGGKVTRALETAAEERGRRRGRGEVSSLDTEERLERGANLAEKVGKEN